MQLEEYRSALERFHEALQREQYLYFSGRKEQLALLPIYSEHSDLFRLETVREIDSELAAVPVHLETPRKGLRKLRAFAIEHAVAQAASALDKQIAEFRSRHTVLWEGAQVPLRRLAALQASEPSAARRRRLEELRRDALIRSNPLRLDRERTLAGAARGLGFETTLEMHRSTTGIDYDRLSAAASEILEATRADYFDRLGPSLERRAGVGPGEAERCDLPYWSRRVEFAGFFPGDRLRETVSDTFAGLGIDLDAQPGLELDLEARPLKVSRPFCAALRVPGDVKVVLLPRGGADDHRGLLHELGHAEHFLWTGAGLAAEHRLLGDRALAEAFGVLFENLVHDEIWLADRMSTERLGEYLRLEALVRAHLVRRHAGRLLFDLRFDSETVAHDPGKEYAELLRESTGVGYDREDYLEDREEGLLAASAYLRAWMFVAQLEDMLRSRFGHAWFSSRGAASLLKEIWETGQLYTADELARELGFTAMDPSALIEELLEGLRR